MGLMGLCPDNEISEGRVLWVGTRKVNCCAATSLRMAAQSLHHSTTFRIAGSVSYALRLRFSESGLVVKAPRSRKRGETWRTLASQGLRPQWNAGSSRSCGSRQFSDLLLVASDVDVRALDAGVPG